MEQPINLSQICASAAGWSACLEQGEQGKSRQSVKEPITDYLRDGSDIAARGWW